MPRSILTLCRDRIWRPRRGSPPARLAQEGFAALCTSGDDDCLNRARQISASGSSAIGPMSLVPRFLGTDGPPQTFTLLLVPPLRRGP